MTTPPPPPGPGTSLEAVLFDMDGTLSDTEDFWQRAEEHIVAEHGTWTVTDRAPQQVGASMTDGARFLRQHHGVALSVAEINRLTIDLVRSQIAAGFRWRPGALELLAEASSRDLATALVTSSPAAIARAVVDSLPRGSFDVLVTDEDVSRNKPDPEPYRLAAARLGIEPSRCLALEDSPTGVRSAHRAGCRVVAVPTHATIEPRERLTVLSSLRGVTVDHLEALTGR